MAERRLKRLRPQRLANHLESNAQCHSPWLSALEQAVLPATMTLRAIKGSCYHKGFRVRQVTVVTTLLDPQLYPAQEILQAYLRRWRLEMCLDDLKTTLQMECLRSRSPEMVQKELCTRLIAHNLIRCIMAQAASEHAVPLERISFKGSLDALRHFTHAMARARSKERRQQLWTQAAPHPGRGSGSRATGPTRTTRRQTQEKQIPTVGYGAPQIPRSSQTQHPPKIRPAPQARSYVSAIPLKGLRHIFRSSQVPYVRLFPLFSPHKTNTNGVEPHFCPGNHTSAQSVPRRDKLRRSFTSVREASILGYFGRAIFSAMLWNTASYGVNTHILIISNKW